MVRLLRVLGLFAGSILFSLALVSHSAAKAQADESVKEWSFLIFMNGNNSLDPYTQMNINEMEQTGSSSQINVLVQWSSKARGTAQRLFIKKDSDPENVTSPVVQDLGKTDMGDVRSLSDFIQWGVAHYPAKHYFIDVWNHGSGWHDALRAEHRSRLIRPANISFDETTGHSISTPQLGKAMSDAAALIGHKVDIYGSDACLMAMAEISGEMAESVDVYAGSEETEPEAGWAYGPILQKWTQDPTMDSRSVAKLVTHEYIQGYSGGVHGTDQGVTFSAFDLSNMNDFNQAMSNLSYEILAMSPADLQKLRDAISQSSRFDSSDYGDVGDFLDHVSQAGLSSRNVSAVRNALQRLVLANEASVRYSWATGVALWLPEATDYRKYAEDYATLQFAQSTHWGDVLKALNAGQ